MGGAAHRGDGQGVTIGIAVIADEGCGGDRDRRALSRRRADVVRCHRRLVSRTAGGVEHDVDPEVRRLVRVRREHAAAAVGKDAVAAGGRCQRTAGHGRGEEVGRVGIMADLGVIGDGIDLSGRQRDRSREGRALPAAGRLAGEGDGCKLLAGARPELAGVGARVLAALVEPYAGCGAGDRGLEFYPEFDRARVRGVDDGRGCARREQ